MARLQQKSTGKSKIIKWTAADSRKLDQRLAEKLDDYQPRRFGALDWKRKPITNANHKQS